MKKKKNIWDFWAAHYEGLWVQKYSLKPTRQMVIAEIVPLLKTSLHEEISLLDLGCGTGQLLGELAQASGRDEKAKMAWVGVDASAEMVAAAQKKKIPGTRFLLGDAHHLPFAGDYFDILTCSHSFPYYRDQRSALDEMVRVIKPGGQLFLVQASVNDLYDRLIMSLVKLTTGRATYPSAVAARQLFLAAGMGAVRQKRIQTASFMPSIILTIGRRERTDENIAD